MLVTPFVGEILVLPLTFYQSTRNKIGMAATPASCICSGRMIEDLRFSRSFVTRKLATYDVGLWRFKVGGRRNSGCIKVQVGVQPRMVPVEEALAIRKKVSNGSVGNGRANLAVVPERKRILPEMDVTEELVLDEGFSWSREDYTRLERTIDVWSFVVSLRARVYLDEAKWTYIGGFSEEKQAILSHRFHMN